MPAHSSRIFPTVLQAASWEPQGEGAREGARVGAGAGAREGAIVGAGTGAREGVRV